MRDPSADFPAPIRRLVHRRSIEIECYARDDGLWDLQAQLRDVKTRDITLSEQLRPAGAPVHDLLLVVTIDSALDIVAARSHTLASPYATCGDHEDAYQRLVGLNLLRGFRAAVRERLGGVLGCTHLTELTQVLPTAAIQGLAGLVQISARLNEPDRPPQMPFQLNRCHALRLDGPAVARFYPRWARPAAPQRATDKIPNPQIEDDTT
ncbi:MAG: DUF2889 domain-containing protein [Thiomonas sp.]|jgi:hypothetical protein